MMGASIQIGEELQRFENVLGALGSDGPKAIGRAMNRAGDMARTQVVRTLAKQSGLQQKLIRRAVKAKRASWSDLEYRLTSAGGDVSLKYFKKRETQAGVVAQLGASRGAELFESSFFRGGLFPSGRVDLRMNGHVFVRRGSRTDLGKLRSGVVIPIEMVSGETAKAFETSAADNLPRRLDHEFGRLLGV